MTVTGVASASGSGEDDSRATICCVGGGKGGTGKSVLSLNLACTLAREGLQVILADMDLGGANLHILAGLRRSKASLRDFIGGKVDDLSKILVAIEDLGIRLLPGGDDVAGMAQPGFQRKRKLIRALRKLEADVVVCDLGGNSGLDTLDLFNAADWGLLVTTPEPTAIQNAYGFVKASLLRKMLRTCPPGTTGREMAEELWNPAGEGAAETISDFVAAARLRDPEAADVFEEVVRSRRYSLVVNQSEAAESVRVYRTLSAVARKFLAVEVNFLGNVADNDEIREAISCGRAPLLGNSLFTSKVWEYLGSTLEPMLAVGINEEINLSGEILHVQTEDLGKAAATYHTLVYSGGRVLLSKRVPYNSSFFSRGAPSLKQDRVRFLHRTVIRAILAGKIKLNLNDRCDDESRIEECEVDHVAGRDGA